MESEENEKLVDGRGAPSAGTASAIALSASLIGFLEAISRNAGFFKQSEQLKAVSGLQRTLSDKYLLSLESTLSSIRTSNVKTGFIKEWKQYLKHYAATGRPFGALALQRGFASFVQSCASTFVLDPEELQSGTPLQALMTRLSSQRQLRVRADPTLANMLATVAAQEMTNVEEGSDYLNMGSSWQQQVGHSIKASSLVAYLFCSLADEQAADQEKLITWLENSLADPLQSMDLELANAVLRCMAVLSATSAGKASKMSRSIQNFLVGGAIPDATTAVAAECLSFILKLLPQDTTITTLYSLGNSLSASSSTETTGHFALFNDGPGHANTDGEVNGIVAREKSPLSEKQPPSQSSAQPTGAYNSILSAIIIIAKASKDETVTALSVSMLVQKVGKVNRAVDLKIIQDAATLVVDGGVAEFRALLRLYQKLHQEGIANNNQMVLQAVS